MQSPQSASTPRRLTLCVTLGYYLGFFFFPLIYIYKYRDCQKNSRTFNKGDLETTERSQTWQTLELSRNAMSFFCLASTTFRLNFLFSYRYLIPFKIRFLLRGCQNNTSAAPDKNALFGCASLLATSWDNFFWCKIRAKLKQPIAQPLRLKYFSVLFSHLSQNITY